MSLQSYLAAETETDRLLEIERMCEAPSSDKRILALKSCLSFFPSPAERSRMASKLNLSWNKNDVRCDWSIVQQLLQDSDQDVIGNAINALTHARNRALGHRLLRYAQSADVPQRVLYCLARYAEETLDVRLACYLSHNFTKDLSDAFLARTFNALFRLGIKDKVAVQVALELVEAHVRATNMDRKAAVAAVVYLCFAGDGQIIDALMAIRHRVSIPELRRLLSWGLKEVNSLRQRGCDVLAARDFLKRSCFDDEPNYTGYGCFTEETLLGGLYELIHEIKDTSWPELTKLVLALGNSVLIENLALHPILGLNRALEQNQIAVVDLWSFYAPLQSETFVKSVRQEKNLNFWNASNPEIIAMTLKVEDLSLAAFPFCARLLAYERLKVQDEATRNDFLRTIENDLSKDNQLYESLYILAHGSFSLQQIVSQVKNTSDISRWYFASLVDQVGFSAVEPYLSEGLNRLDAQIQNGQDVLDSVACNLFQLLPYFDSKPHQGLIKKVAHFCSKIQEILDVIELQPNPENAVHDDDDDDDVATWSGKVVKFKTFLIIKEIILGSSAQSNFLAEQLRCAPHGFKKWIVRTLVKVDDDVSIKAILQDAFKHVDKDLVNFTARELLASNNTRSHQALVRALGRQGLSEELKLLILEELSEHDSRDILHELKSLESIKLPDFVQDALRDAIGKISAKFGEESENLPLVGENTDVESIIKKELVHFNRLSVDSLSAIRTAEMIHAQSVQWAGAAVDLSPIVNMHFKAVELTMRDFFEPQADAILRKGQLGRRLDLLGYARPIPEKMQVFEDYLASLPIVKNIPYFSKFKLRKMLRGMCLYRPGKRFTLDGPKAFALFFLVIARKNCVMGCEQFMDLGFKSDHELFEFVKLVHELQDSRNRAVHEGLTWEARDDIQGMRAQSYAILNVCLDIQSRMDKKINSPVTERKGA